MSENESGAQMSRSTPSTSKQGERKRKYSFQSNTQENKKHKKIKPVEVVEGVISSSKLIKNG